MVCTPLNLIYLNVFEFELRLCQMEFLCKILKSKPYLVRFLCARNWLFM